MSLTPSKFFIQKQNHMLKMAAQSLVGGSIHPFTQTSIKHVSQLVWTCVNTFWIHNFIINNPTKSYSQQVRTHSANLTQNSRTPKFSMGGRKEKHLHPYPTSQKPILRLNGIWSFIGPPLRAHTSFLSLNRVDNHNINYLRENYLFPYLQITHIKLN